jgi:UDP-2,4-diacetamido-2,4,6-trideoxy-beta-L-altropyranose hydrolase
VNSALAAKLVIRAAHSGDERRLFEWRNDPFVIARTTTQRPVSLAEHISWFRAALQDTNRRLSVIEVCGQPAGAIRFDRVDQQNCVISVYLMQAFTGHGYGTKAIEEASDEISRAWAVNVIAYVRNDNDAAAKSFERARFREVEADEKCPAGHRAFILARDA